MLFGAATSQRGVGRVRAEVAFRPPRRYGQISPKPSAQADPAAASAAMGNTREIRRRSNLKGNEWGESWAGRATKSCPSCCLAQWRCRRLRGLLQRGDEHLEHLGVLLVGRLVRLGVLVL